MFGFSRLLAFLILISWSTLVAQSAASEPWWKHAVIYQIYPRSFYDTTGDGIGDLNGITAKLDYIQSLGFDAIWLNPCYPSPLFDTGYDITDYENIDPQYGTLADFDRLVAEARKRHIRVIMDLVLPHTSEEHSWFQESASSRTNPKADWYIWADGKDGKVPNNWQSFDPAKTAWQFDAARGQYYYHIYSHKQPELNWRNPDVKKRMFGVARFWLNRGVAGFRLDSAAFLYVDDRLRDNTYSKEPTFEEITYAKYTWNRPEYHAAMRELRGILDGYAGHPVLIGETDSPDIATLRTMFGAKDDEIQLPMNFALSWSHFSAAELRGKMSDWDQNDVGGWPLYFFSNHDFLRSYSRFGDGKHNLEIAKVMAALLLTARGTPIVYYGEELGLDDAPEEAVQREMDKSGKIRQPPYDPRDSFRTPMQWNGNVHAGFTEAHPWLPVELNYKTTNVAAERADRGSLLNLYQKLIALRRATPTLREGAYVPLNPDDKEVLSYVRKPRGPGHSVVVVLNMSSASRTVALDLPDAKTLLSVGTGSGSHLSLRALTLDPYGIFIGELQ